jgi:hypothetical protein
MRRILIQMVTTSLGRMPKPIPELSAFGDSHPHDRPSDTASVPNAERAEQSDAGARETAFAPRGKSRAKSWDTSIGENPPPAR